VPNDEAHKTISRHHCLLDINPPDICVRDFGSKNGTYVNSTMIGKRESHQTPTEGAQIQFPEYKLVNGDEIRLQDTIFRISVFVPAYCVECSRELSEAEKEKTLSASGWYQCEECAEKTRKAGVKQLPNRKLKLCAGCGKDASSEIGENRQGDFLCSTCQADTWPIVTALLKQADLGDSQFRAIQGYEVLSKLGEGGMGAVYMARRATTGKTTVIKLMLPQVAADQHSKEMFKREVENTRVLNHPNVVELYDWGFSNGAYFFTMEYCDGGSVTDLIKKRDGRLSIDEAIKITLQALDALEYAHHAPIPYVKLKDGGYGPGRGLVHRDVKPGNIFLAHSEKGLLVKVGDYGLAKAFDMAGFSGLTRSGTAMGTPYFVCRQQVLNFKYAKPEVDVWAMAASLYNMLTGSPPREFSRTKDVWQTILETAPVRIRDRDPSIPKSLADVIDQALIDEPSISFKSAADFRQALAGALK
jgi:serine/threonine-protein kinase